MSTAHVLSAATSRPVAAVRPTARLAYVDTLRVVLAVLVVAHHAGQAYGPTGGDWPVFNPTRAALLGPFFAVNAAFFMGLFFLIAGYFVPYAYDRKGAARFLIERCVRLGVPLLLVSLVLAALAYASNDQEPSLPQVVVAFLRRPDVGHMWFAGHLLVYAAAYVVWRRLVGQHAVTAISSRVPPGNRSILTFTIGLAAVSFVVRITFPIDRWVELVPFIRAEVAHLPQYLSLYILGIVAYRRDWFGQLPTAVGMTWLRIGLLAAALPYGIGMLRALTPLEIALFEGGGLTMGSLLWSTVEAAICVGLCIGLLTFMREHAKRPARLVGKLAGGSYAVYAIHVFPVVGLQMALAAAPMAPLVKFSVITLIAVPLSFGLAYALRRVPGVARVL